MGVNLTKNRCQPCNQIQDSDCLQLVSPYATIRITVSGPSIITKEYVPWHVQEIQVTMEVEAVEAEDEKLSPTSILSSPILIAVLLVGIFVIGFVAQRLYDRMSQSGYDIVLDDDDEYLVDDEDDEAYAQEDSFEDEVEEVPLLEPLPWFVLGRVSMFSQQTFCAEVLVFRVWKQFLLQQSSNEVVRKRRARRSEHDTVTTKRRKLSDSQPIDTKPRKRRAVKRETPTDDEM